MHYYCYECLLFITIYWFGIYISDISYSRLSYSGSQTVTALNHKNVDPPISGLLRWRYFASTTNSRLWLVPVPSTKLALCLARFTDCCDQDWREIDRSCSWKWSDTRFKFCCSFSFSNKQLYAWIRIVLGVIFNMDDFCVFVVLGVNELPRKLIR